MLYIVKTIKIHHQEVRNVLSDRAEHFVADWSGRNVESLPRRRNFGETVEDLTSKLQIDAWAFGLGREEFLQAVDGDAFEYVLDGVERESRERPWSA